MIRLRESCLLISAFVSTKLFLIFDNARVVLFPELNLFRAKVGDGNGVFRRCSGLIEKLNGRQIVTKSCIDVITSIGHKRFFECSLLMKYDSLFRVNST